ncbi:glucose dehydrogenase [FAD, quinone]-like [Uranotaenia lowii]|uniref:glucose dehydrogenase [FAD, quinone]-like n=1 Tax=Uranotaenia lowii TaxID=190385 RepID=UPI00247936A5|nr:glucose dehydrogenase [FAD, quinone]-like [Uranotaenia lowii]
MESILSILTILGNQSSSDSVSEAFNGFSSEYLYGVTRERIQDVNNILNQYDFIIVGAGSGGSVMANQLSENPNWNVLLLEAGVEENFLLSVPLPAALNQRTSYNWNYAPERSSHKLCVSQPAHLCTWPAGRGLGGTSLLNYMIYTRGHYRDYDEWSEAGNDGWSYEEVRPYFEKGEREFIHPVTIPYETPLYDEFKEAVESSGYSEVTPQNKTQLGFYKLRSTTVKGQRNSAARIFLHPARNRPNLHISIRSHVTKVLIDSETKQAFGVEFVKNGESFKVQTKKEIILSAGTIGSAKLLLLSGVGPQEQLRNYSIPVIKTLPVGHNLHDHYGSPSLRFSVKQRQPEMSSQSAFEQYLNEGYGPFTIPFQFESIAFMKSGNSQLPQDFPDFEALFMNTQLQKSPSRAFQLFGLDRALGSVGLINNRNHSTIIIAILYIRPKSRGQISLKSNDPFAHPELKPGYFEHPDDEASFCESVKTTIELGESQPLAQLGAKFDRTYSSQCDNFTIDSDAFCQCFIRNYVWGTYHLGGTCKMGPKGDPTAVVSPELLVHGIENLRVVDGSVIPAPIAGHPNGVIYMIGHKAADMIRKRWQ